MKTHLLPTLAIVAAFSAPACTQVVPSGLDPPPYTPPAPDLALATAAPPDLRRPVDRTGLPPSTLHHVLGTGQSLSVGIAGKPALSTTQPYDNLMFSTGVVAGGERLDALVPLVETDVETPSSAFAGAVTRAAREQLLGDRPPPDDTHDLLVSAHGSGGAEYAMLRQGTVPYRNGMAQVRAGMALAARAGRPYRVTAVTVVHGESDNNLGNTHYDRDLLAWQSDYESDIQAITGQSDPIPMLHSQVSSWTVYGYETSAIPLLQLAASDDRPDRLILVGPKYHLPYSDCVHLTNHGYRQMGELYAKVYRRVVIEGRPWSPLRPLAATRRGRVITITFHVPVPPLVLDTARVSDPGSHGFEFADDSPSPPAIARVTVVAPDRVEITLARDPTGAHPTIRYALRGRPNACAGPRSGPRGNLRDSDDTRSPDGYELHDWAVHFAIEVR